MLTRRGVGGQVESFDQLPFALSLSKGECPLATAGIKELDRREVVEAIADALVRRRPVVGVSSIEVEMCECIEFLLQAIATALEEAIENDHTDPVTDPVARLLAHLAGGELAPSELQARLELKHRPTFRANYLRPALEQGLVEMTQPEKPTSRLQKYRLTAAGKLVVARLG